MCWVNEGQVLGRGHWAKLTLAGRALPFVALGLEKAAQHSCSHPFSPNSTSLFLEIPDQAQPPLRNLS